MEIKKTLKPPFFRRASSFGARHQARRQAARCGPARCSPGRGTLSASPLRLFSPASRSAAPAPSPRTPQPLSQLPCSSFPGRPRRKGTLSPCLCDRQGSVPLFPQQICSRQNGRQLPHSKLMRRLRRKFGVSVLHKKHSASSNV